MDSKTAAQDIVAAELAKINERPRVQLMLTGEGSVQCFAQIKNGRGPRTAKGDIPVRLPIMGSRDISRIGDDLDRERAELVVVFTVSGIINGVLYEGVSIWIQGDGVSLPTLFSGTQAASAILYRLGRAVRDRVVAMPALMDQAWEGHVAAELAKIKELTDYLDAVTAATELVRKSPKVVYQG